jgi:hypothetical protein
MAERYKPRQGGTASLGVSPLPQEDPAGGNASPQRQVDGFSAGLPTRSRTFFQRDFWMVYPKPIFVAGTSPFPRNLTIIRFRIPSSQVLVIRDVSFHAYQHSGIGVDDIVAVPPGRIPGTFAFSFSVGNRGMVDYATTLPGTPSAGALTPEVAGVTVPRTPQANLYSKTGSIAPRVPEQTWAAYGRPNDDVVAQVNVLRPPNFDVRAIEVEISGWLANESEFDRIIRKLVK